MSRIALIDPMTLLGRECLNELRERNYDLDEVTLFHTSEVEEHQVTAAGGRAMLVSRLQEPDDLADTEIMVLCSDAETERLDILDRVLETRQDLLLVDASSISRYEHLGKAIASGKMMPSSRRVRVADPALVMATHLLEAFDGFQIRGISLVSVQPVSALGESGIQILAGQAARRLRGENIDQDERILAFNMNTSDPGRLRRDGAALFPGLELTVALVTGSCFHGHLLHLGLRFVKPVTAEEVETVLRSSDVLRRVDFPMDLSLVPDQRQILVGEPFLSESGASLLLQAMADGSRVGGAIILADLLESGLG